MNKITIKNSKIVTKIDKNIIFKIIQKEEIFDILQIELNILKDTELEIENISKKTKLDLKIYIEPNVKFHLIEGIEAKETKIQNKYFLKNNSHVTIDRMYDVKKAKQLDLIFLNEPNATINLNFTNIAIGKGNYDIVCYHNAKKTNFKLQNKGITIKDGTLVYHVTNMVYQGMKDCIIEQNNRILTLNNKKNTIVPILLIEENEVSANHSALIGSIKPEELFYFQMRGIKKEEATNLIVRGYLKTNHKMFKKIIDKYWRWVMNRNDFEILKSNIIYFDNGATTLKPKVLSEAVSDYYNKYSANAHRGDYDMSLKVDTLYETTRTLVQKFINAKSKDEIIFTNNSTDSLNKIIFGYYQYHLKENDEVIITKTEHASNVLPWFELKDKLGIKIIYLPLTKDHKVTLDNLKKVITSKTKVVSLAHVTNVIGDVRPIKEISMLLKEKSIDLVVDGAQSVPHMITDVQNLDIDFLAFSAHKMYGPTGVGILYGKKEKLNMIRPIIFGGGMNATFQSDGFRIYSDLPTMLEAGTPNIAGVLGFKAVLEYLNNIGMDNIYKHEKMLKEYTLKRLKEIKNIVIYNESSESAIITFNYADIFAQDLAIYLNKYHICVRAGNHCAKMVKEEINIKNTVRISFSFYNTKEEIDKLIEVLKKDNIKEEII